MALVQRNHQAYVERLSIAAGFVLLFLLLWTLRSLLIVLFGAVVFAVMLRALADMLMVVPGIRQRWSVVIAVLLIALIVGAVFWLFGQHIADQFAVFGDTFPIAWHNLQHWIESLPLGREMLKGARRVATNGSTIVGRLGDILLMLGNAGADLLLILFGAIFIAAEPQLYKAGLLKLLPSRYRDLWDQALASAGRALRLWLIGQLISMIVVGLLIGIGLGLLGVPSAHALGLIAGLLEAVPYLGPILSAVPGLLLAFMESPKMALGALLIYVAVQQIEGHTLIPLIQRQTVILPPALTLFSVIAAGIAFGILGLIFAAPLLVVCYVLVKRLYVQQLLHTPTPIPGERGDGNS